MAESGDTGSAGQYAGVERRAHPRLRDDFEQAYRIAFPLLSSNQGSAATRSSHFLRVVLRDAFPRLHQQDIAILAASIERVFRERNKSASQ